MHRIPLRVLVFVAGSLLVTHVAGSARADEVDNLGGKVSEIETRLRELDAKLQISGAASPEVAERRLIDAQVLYELKNYEAASIMLLDVVEKYANTDAYPEALFLLADSLYLKRDFFSARHYFEQVIKLGSRARHVQEALQRLVELSLYTGDYSRVDDYLSKLSGVPFSDQIPSAPYVTGKYYYFRQAYDQAERVFQAVPQSNPYWFQSQYFLGASLVAKKKLNEALLVFSKIALAPPQNDVQKRIVELTRLALGRINYEQGQFANAYEEYGKIAQKSTLFPDALWEQAWVAIKGQEFQKAFRALELLLTIRPDDPISPEVKLLIANLHLRQEEYTKANLAFVRTRDEFEPIRKEMEAKTKGNAVSYFRELISKNLGKFDSTIYLPPLAIKWVKDDPEIERVTRVVGDVSELKRSLADAQEILRRVIRAIDGPARINAFSDLAHARARSIELAHQLSDVVWKLVSMERELELPVASPAERLELERLSTEHARLEKQIVNAPNSVESLEDHQRRARAQFNELDKRAAELNVLIANYSATRVAVDSYYKSTQAEQKLDPADFAKAMSDAKSTEDELRNHYAVLRDDIGDASQTVGVGDADVRETERVRARLNDIMQQEHNLGSAMRSRLSGFPRFRADQLASILYRAHAAQKSFINLNVNIDKAVETRFKEVRSSLVEEERNVTAYRESLSQYETKAASVGGGVTAENFRNITERFYQIVVRADVGIIDVAWALKQEKTDENSRLVREEKRELKLLDDDFKELKE